MSDPADNPTNVPHRGRRLALVDADVRLHHTARQHLSGAEAGWHVDAYTSTYDAWQGIAVAPPQLVLMDISPPTATGLHCLHTIRARLPEVPVVVYTARDCAFTLVQAMAAGARGYLIKPLPPAELVSHLHKATTGGLALCSRAEQRGCKAWTARAPCWACRRENRK